MTISGDQIGKIRSRLEVLPPSASAVSEAGPAVEEPMRTKRKLRVEPLAEESSVSMTDAIDPDQEKTSSKKLRNPLPLASPPMTEPIVAEASLVETELAEPSEAMLAKPEPQPVRTDEQQLQAINHWHEAVESEPMSAFDRVAKFMSGWATSFVIHMLLIIIFALFTFGIPDKGGLTLSLGSVDTEKVDTDTFDVSVNFETIDDAGGVEFDNVVPEDLSDELSHETLDASDVLAALDEFGVESLAGEGIDSGFDDGGMAEGASGRKGVAGESIDFFGSFAEGQRFVFVIDCSGSMNGDRWTRAKYELERSIDGLGEEQQFCVILYNSYATIMLDSRKVELLNATEENKSSAIDWLDKQYPNGGTYPRPAVMAALRVDPDAIFLLSDGEIQDNTREFLLAKNSVKDEESGSYRKIPVHTIALLSTFGQTVLNAIADENEGTFTRVGRR